MKKRILIIFTTLLCSQFVGCGNSNLQNANLQSTSEIESEIDSETSESLTNQIDNGLEKEVNQEKTEAEPEIITIVMVGDMLLHDRIEQYSKTEDGSYNFAPIFDSTKNLISEADLAIANQEVIIGGQEIGISGYPAFNAPYEFADALVDVGFDVVCHGTNHALDKGKNGIVNCLANWEEKYPEIGVLGIYDSAEEKDEIYIVEVNGIKIAILNYTYGTNGITPPEDMPYAVNYLNEEKVVSDLTLAEETADFTIVCPHWGTEYVLEPDASQKKWTKIFSENGADLILGTHPHVIEPVEWYDDTLVYYSLGNFVNWTSGEGEGVAKRMLGMMAKVSLLKDSDGNVTIDSYEAIPLVSHVTSNVGGICVYPLDEYTDILASENEINKQTPEFSLEYCRNLATSVLEETKNE